QQSEQGEGHHDREQGEDRARLLPEQAGPEQRQVPHARTPLSVIVPLSRWTWRRAYSAASGSCVTITTVLPWSLFSICSSRRTSSAGARSRTTVGSSQTRRGG